MLLSVVAEPIRIKALRAILNGAASRTEIKWGGATITSKYRSLSHGYLSACEEGYRSYAVRLGYNLSHVLMVSKAPGFMVSYSEDALWSELQRPEFTTPLIREWIPYLATKLRDSGYLTDCASFNSNCAILKVASTDLDQIVEYGLKNRDISIPVDGVIDTELAQPRKALV